MEGPLEPPWKWNTLEMAENGVETPTEKCWGMSHNQQTDKWLCLEITHKQWVFCFEGSFHSAGLGGVGLGPVQGTHTTWVNPSPKPSSWQASSPSGAGGGHSKNFPPESRKDRNSIMQSMSRVYKINSNRKIKTLGCFKTSWWNKKVLNNFSDILFPYVCVPRVTRLWRHWQLWLAKLP